MYDRMVREHGYSIRKLADKLGKDKGYLENRLRLADAPPEIRELVSLRKDSAVPRLRVDEGRGPEEASSTGGPGRAWRADPHQAPRQDRGSTDAPEGQGRRRRPTTLTSSGPTPTATARRSSMPGLPPTVRTMAGQVGRVRSALTEDSLVNAKQQLAEAIEELVEVLRQPGCPAGDPVDGSGEPREIPDDHEAQARERDRDGPERRPGPLARAGHARHPRQPGRGEDGDPDGLRPPTPALA